MKVLFVKTEISVSAVTNFDPGIGLMSAVLKNNGHETSYFNIRSLEKIDEFERRIKLFKPDIIGFSCTATTFFLSDKFAQVAKKINKKIFCITGGVHVTLNPSDFLKTSFLDAVCIGEGEFSLLELANRYKTGDFYDVPGINFKKNKKIIVNKKRSLIDNLDILPVADREIFANEGTLFFTQEFKQDGKTITDSKMEFMFSRGCPFDCTYCSNNALKKVYGNNYIRIKSPELAIKEIEEVVKKYRVNSIIFHDDIFILNKKWVMEFLSLYIKKINLPFECNIRVGVNTDKETIGKLKEAGCTLVKIGVESGSERVRSEILNRHMSNKQIIEVCKLFDRYGINVRLFLIVGFPGETKKDFLKTVDLAAKLDCKGYVPYIFYPYPGTKLYEICKDNIVIKDSSDFNERTLAAIESIEFPKNDVEYFYEVLGILIELKKIEKNKVKNIYKNILFKLYMVEPSNRFFWMSRISIFMVRFPVTMVKKIFG